MDQRKMMLPEGWYPHSFGSAEMQLKSWESIKFNGRGEAAAGIAPHAGWDFSGSMAWQIINSIPRDCDLVIIAGGHLSSSAECRVLDYSSLATPFGELYVDRDILQLLCSGFMPDRDTDNTVEIMLPMIKYLLPQITVLPVRMPASVQAADWGRRARQICSEKGKKTFLLGSTDLSHYGARFGYMDYGLSDQSRDAVREKDSKYLELLAALKAEESISYAFSENTACSSGAAAAAAGFALEAGIPEGRICEHKYSYEVYDSGSDFVGYGSVLYQ